jgi:hypothetical protein
MKPKGPYVTLLAGLVTAAVLFGLGANAKSKDTARQQAANPPPATTAPATVSPTPSAAPIKQVNAVYAGRVNGGGATIAITVRDGRAVAYLCDGSRVEAWLQGIAAAGKLSLTGRNGSLSGTYAAGAAKGSVAAAGKQWSFAAPVAKAPSGLYRATATVRNAKVIGGWIVLPDGTQVGVVSTDDKPAPAPRLDPATGSATVDGTSLTAAPVDAGTGI